MRRTYRKVDEPNMSDSSLLLKVEDLISMALGPETQNLVNFKHIQTVLFMLARQLRMLEQQVEIRLFESEEERIPVKKKSEKKIKKSRMTIQDLADKKDKALDKKGKKQKEVDESDEDADVLRRGTRKKTEKDIKQIQAPEKEKKLTDKESKPTDRDRSPADKRVPADRDRSPADKRVPADRERSPADKRVPADKERSPADKKVPTDIEKMPGEKERLPGDKRVTADREKVAVDKEKKHEEKEKKHKIKAAVSDSSIYYKDRKTLKTGRPHVGSVDVVTQAEFEGLAAAVRELEQMASMPLGLTMPDNQKLRDDLLQGNASVSEAMQTMQVNARVQAAEEAIRRMAGLLTQLASTGSLPANLASDLLGGRLDLTGPGLEDLEQIMRQRKETARGEARDRATGAWQGRPDPSRAFGTFAGAGATRMTGRREERAVDAETEAADMDEAEAEVPPPPAAVPTDRRDPTAPVTMVEFDEMVAALKKQMSFNIQQMTTKANIAADNAAKNAQLVAEKMDTAMAMAERINVLQLLVGDYAVQLNGFDAGLTTQMQGFQEQMNQMRSDLKSGLEQLAAVNNNTEAIALAELTGRYENMVVELDDVNNTHQALFTVQTKLSDELRNLMESVEMLRDQKSDRDEVLDALRDKADISRLTGLLTEEKFAEARSELEKLLDICRDKFKRQDKTWMGALEDIMKALETKAGQTELLSERKDVETRLQELHEHLQRLEEQLGDPVAALLMRRLGRGAVCGSCGTSALMTPGNAAQPPALPPLQPAPHPPPAPSIAPAGDADTSVCIAHPHVEDVKMPVRWCGGEHTLRAPVRQRVRPAPRALHTTRRYDGIGVDGRLYHLEEDMQPCAECNDLEARKDLEAQGGAGDA